MSTMVQICHIRKTKGPEVKFGAILSVLWPTFLNFGLLKPNSRKRLDKDAASSELVFKLSHFEVFVVQDRKMTVTW